MYDVTDRLPSWVSPVATLALGLLVGGGVALVYDGPYELAPVALGVLVAAGADRFR